MLGFNDSHDWTYSEGCGCRVTFFHESEFHTSRMLPSEECRLHSKRHQTDARDELLRRAKDALRFQRATPENPLI
jgi:hypothetical protein